MWFKKFSPRDTITDIFLESGKQTALDFRLLAGSLVGAVLLSFISIPFVSKAARSLGALANPGGRHIHLEPVPRMGGISVALGFFPVVIFAVPMDRQMISVLASAGLVLALGVYDDIRGATWKEKMAVCIAAASVLIFAGHLYVRDLGNLFGLGTINLGWLSVPFTYFALFGIINAINLIDGLNGLLCGISMLAFLSFAVLGYVTGNIPAIFLSVVCLGAVIGFIPSNYPRARIFLVDTGSLLLGFLIGTVALILIQDDRIKPVVPPLVLLLPIFDTLRVMSIRFFSGGSPFRPDKKHFHHLLLRSGVSSTDTVMFMWMISVVLSFFAVFLRNRPSEFILVIELSLMFFMALIVKNLRSVRLIESKIRRNAAARSRVGTRAVEAGKEDSASAYKA